jgi:fructose-1,6-bisphosphatase II
VDVDRNLALELVRATEAAALAAARCMGKGEARVADAAAFEAMRRALGSVKMRANVRLGRLCIGGESILDSDTELNGEETNGPLVELALDPLECIDSVVTGRPNAMSVVVASTENSFPEVGGLYMEKIAVGPDAAGRIDLDASPLQNLVNVAAAKRCYVEDLTVSILDRERHVDLIRKVREAGARIQLIPDGDLAAAVATAIGDSGVDVLMGIGSAHAAVLSAAALSCVGGDMQCRSVAMRPEDEARIAALTGGNTRRKLGLTDLVGGQNVMFAATGITSSDILSGVRFRKGGARTYSVVMRQQSGTIRFIQATHFFDRKPRY